MDYKNILAGLLAEAAGIDRQFARDNFEVPPTRAMGDYAFPCFKLSKMLRKPPGAIAADMAERLNERLREPSYVKYISSCRADGGYLNVVINRATYMERALTEITAAGESYGASDMGAGKKIVMEYSSPNVAKPFHIGHLCTTMIGNSLDRIFNFLSYKTISVNHIGDWGTQFGKLICAYRRWGDPDALAADTMAELLRVYVRFHKEVKNAPELDDEARATFLRLEEGDPGVVAQWKEFCDLSMKEFERIYGRLSVRFDSYCGESFYQDKMSEVIGLLEARGLLKESDGAKIVDLSEYGLTPCIILKSDGATIYATRDLAAAIYRSRVYAFDKCVYVVGMPQALYFRQIFTILKLLGFEWHKDCVHVGYGHVRFPDRKMATREGETVELEEVLDEAIKRASAMTDAERKLDDPQKVAEAVGIGAIVYNFLKNGREHDFIFKWDEMLDIEGDSGPYLQYTCARASSVLRRAGEMPETADYTLLTADEEYEIVDLLNAYPDVILDAADKYEPSILARHVFAIARAFNKFYNSHKILDSAPGLREARLRLCGAVRAVLGKGLYLLGIEALDQM